MDKKEYRARLDEINSLVEKQDYREALNVVETIESVSYTHLPSPRDA